MKNDSNGLVSVTYIFKDKDGNELNRLESLDRPEEVQVNRTTYRHVYRCDHVDVLISADNE